MVETIKAGSEKPAEAANTGHLEVLTELGNKFDPDKARRLAEQGKPKTTEKDNTGTNIEERASHLTVTPEKEEKELSPRDAANEYLSLLDELSQDFSYPYYGEERKGEPHHPDNITTKLGLKYSDNPHYRWRGYNGTEAGETDGTMLRIASADNILANEIGWRVEGEKVGKRKEQLDKDIAALDKEYSEKGRLGKFLGRRKYKRTREGLTDSRRRVDYQFTKKYNGNIAKELAISYNVKGYYDYNGADYGESQNEARNRQFFGLDDPERAKKVERAIELRQKYKDEWTKKE